MMTNKNIFNKILKKEILLTSFILVLFNFSFLLSAETVYESGKKQATLVELFTSQGCSSCPPADKRANLFLKDKKLWKEYIPVVFHVDYWDYLGWKDPFSSKDYTGRQYLYRINRNISAVYTPAFIVNGKEVRGAYRTSRFPKQFNKIKYVGKLKGVLNDNQLDISFGSSKSSKKLWLNLAILGNGYRVKIEDGENEDLTINQNFVVLSFNTLKTQSNSQEEKWSVNLADLKINKALFDNNKNKLAVAFWVNPENSPTPIQAAGGWLPMDINLKTFN